MSLTIVGSVVYRSLMWALGKVPGDASEIKKTTPHNIQTLTYYFWMPPPSEHPPPQFLLKSTASTPVFTCPEAVVVYVGSFRDMELRKDSVGAHF